MKWYLLAFVITFVLIATVVSNYLRDRRYLKRKASEVMRDVVRKELEAEEDAAKEKHQKFREALERVKREN